MKKNNLEYWSDKIQIKKGKPFNPELNKFIEKISCKIWNNKINVSKVAPATLHDLTELINNKKYIVVYSGASINTIYSSKKINWNMRAWHDYVHYVNQFEFDIDGEIKTANFQLKMVYDTIGHIPKSFEACIYSDIVSQVEYLFRFNGFPKNQRDVVLDYIKENFPEVKIIN